MSVTSTGCSSCSSWSGTPRRSDWAEERENLPLGELEARGLVLLDSNPKKSRSAWASGPWSPSCAAIAARFRSFSSGRSGLGLSAKGRVDLAPTAW